MASNLETKIDRIASAVTSALSALTAKGVTVPEGANVESLAELIESIEAGGGGTTEPYAKVITGTHTPAINETSITFLPVETLKLRYLNVQESNYKNTESYGANIIRKICVYRSYSQASRVNYASNGHWSMPNYAEYISNDDLVVFPGSSTTVLSLGAGVTYNWIAVYTDT